MIDRGSVVLIGHPVAHSLSPVMHDAALDAAGSALRYVAVDVVPDQLDATLAALRASRSAGNVTIPYKKRSLAAMQKLTPVAMRTGAINTFWVDDDGDLAGDNTDVAGFSQMVHDVVDHIPDGVRVAILGAGGAAAAVATAIESWPGATASVHARDLSRAAAMQVRHSAVVRACSLRDPCLSDATFVVNTTPLGLNDNDDLPVELHRIAPGAVVLDLVYTTSETRLVHSARANGHIAADGLRMLLHQGAASFERWFGVEPDRQAMWAALERVTGRNQDH